MAEASTDLIERDPVCGMTVDPQTARHRHVHGGDAYHFCSAHCREKFADAPNEFIEAEDPVCGMTVRRKSARFMAKHAGARFYFCSSGCETKFVAEPETYLEGRPEAAPAPAGTIYGCPMDPEIEETEPGDCPICGMALEPMGVPTGETGPNPEFVDFRRRFAVAATLTAPLMVVAMGGMVGLPVKQLIGAGLAPWSSCFWRLRSCSGRAGRSWFAAQNPSAP